MTSTPQRANPALTDELLPCPFCSGPAQVEQEPATNVLFPLWWFCGCANPECIGMAHIPFERKGGAIRAWNTRALTSPARGEAEPVAWPDCFPSSRRFSVEKHGSGHALYQGRDQHHHGLNLAHITEAMPETLRMIEDALNQAHPAPPAATGEG